MDFSSHWLCVAANGLDGEPQQSSVELSRMADVDLTQKSKRSINSIAIARLARRRTKLLHANHYEKRNNSTIRTSLSTFPPKPTNSREFWRRGILALRGSRGTKERRSRRSGRLGIRRLCLSRLWSRRPRDWEWRCLRTTLQSRESLKSSVSLLPSHLTSSVLHQETDGVMQVLKHQSK